MMLAYCRQKVVDGVMGDKDNWRNRLQHPPTRVSMIAWMQCGLCEAQYCQLLLINAPLQIL